MNTILLCCCLLLSAPSLHAVYEEGDDLMVEDEAEVWPTDVFQPTNEWKVIEKGQSIPAGLHVRVSMKTGLKEAKLMEPTEERHTDARTVEEESSKFTKDQRRSHHYGDSDRRGIVNKRTKAFSLEEYIEMMRDNHHVDLTNLPAITHEQTHTFTRDTPLIDIPLPLSVHGDMVAMINLTRTLSSNTTSFDVLLDALNELEYYVHEIDNARDLSRVGGLAPVVRLLNHTHPDIKGTATLVVGSACQSNPSVQHDVIVYGGLTLICHLLSASEPEVVQRRALFALGALLRGSPSNQEKFVDNCHEFSNLGPTFHQRSDRVRLKAVTLLTDIFIEQPLPLPALVSLVVSGGWCAHVSSLIYSTVPSLVEGGLQGMFAFRELCDYSRDIPKLRELTNQIEDESHMTILKEHCQLLLRTLSKEL